MLQKIFIEGENPRQRAIDPVFRINIDTAVGRSDRIYSHISTALSDLQPAVQQLVQHRSHIRMVRIIPLLAAIAARSTGALAAPVNGTGLQARAGEYWFGSPGKGCVVVAKSTGMDQHFQLFSNPIFEGGMVPICNDGPWAGKIDPIPNPFGLKNDDPKYTWVMYGGIFPASDDARDVFPTDAWNALDHQG